MNIEERASHYEPNPVGKDDSGNPLVVIPIQMWNELITECRNLRTKLIKCEEIEDK